MSLVNNSEVQSQLASLVQDALRLETQLQNAQNARGGKDSRKDSPRIACVSDETVAKPDIATLQVFQGWLHQELEAHGERLRHGLMEDLGQLFRHNTIGLQANLQEHRMNVDYLQQPKPSGPSPETPSKLVSFEVQEEEEEERDKDTKLPGMVPDESAGPKSRKSYRFAGPGQAEINDAKHRKTIRGAMGGVDEIAPCPVVPDGADLHLPPKDAPAQKEPWAPLDPVEKLREMVRRNFVENTCFGYVIITFIVLNSMMMGIQADWMVTHIGQTAPEVFDVLENIFAVIFTCELTLRILVYHVRFFRMPDWKWNLFDSVVVGLQILDIITTLSMGDDANATAETGTGNLSFMRIIRLMRLLRILRLMRLLRFVQELRSMVMSIAASLKSLMWTIILLAFLMYGVGVCLTQMIADKGLEEPRIMENAPEIKEFYGSLPEALVSLFAGITGGIDWNDLLMPLEEQISPWLAAVFVLYIAFAVLAMMNVVTGIFVESALQSTRADEEKEVRAQLDDMFKHVDKEKNGTISWQEFVRSLDNPEMKRCFESLGFDMAEAYGLFNLLDTDQSGEIDCEELLEGCLRLRGTANAIDVATLQYSSKRVFEWWRGKMDCLEELLACILEILEQVPVAADKDRGEHIKAATEKLQKAKEEKSKEDHIFDTWRKLRSREKFQ
mmetsp:Transcript_37770/g.87408  ORF Transcript_37770/g.87408 Transcript_37770/m.87408 type:complete len:670 (+) Transcript_37770:63-2072(+)